MKAWETFLEEQEKELGQATVKKWLSSLRVVKFDAQNLYLEAKDTFQALWFEEHIRKKLNQSFINNNFSKIKVHLSCGKPFEAARAKKTSKIEPVFSLSFDKLNPHFTFDTFHICEEHKIPLEIFTDTSNFNPIYLWGPSGVGKTHLLTALAHTWVSKGLKVIYERAETFTEHVVSAIRASRMAIFREAYRKADALLLDDVHELAHKGATQEELFHTFNTLHLAGKHIVLASSFAPGRLEHIEPRLVSRFEWGIVLPFKTPADKEKEAILELQSQTMRFPLHPKVRAFLASTFKSNTKGMIQALEALILRSHTEGKGIVSTSLTVPLAKHYLRDLIAHEEAIKISPEMIIQAVAEYFSVRPEEILGASQARDATFPRQMAMFLCREELKLPYKKIGHLFERDHSTVMTSYKAIKSQSETEATQLCILKKII